MPVVTAYEDGKTLAVDLPLEDLCAHDLPVLHRELRQSHEDHAL